MKVSAFARIGAGAGIGALVLAGLALPAQADPAPGTFGKLSGLGSDTTQDVSNGLGAAIGQGLLASYDASGPTITVTTRAGGKAIPRANGSGAGRDLLRAAIGQTETASIAVLDSPTVQVTTADVAGEIQFARSSSAASSSELTDDGVLAYIPFAKDAVSYAVAPNSVIPANLTKSQVASIFQGQLTKVVVNGATTTLEGPSYSGPGEVTDITTFIPQAGSGTRSYWLGQVNITEAQITAGTFPNIRATDFDGLGVQEHKGAALVSGTDEQNKGTIVPFSIAQWVAQGNAKSTDARAGALIGGVDGQVATTGAAGSYVLNPAFTAYTRPVYNIVPSVLADDPTSDIAKVFVGANSEVCKATSTITAYGFGLLAAGECGDDSVRVYKPSQSQAALTLPATGVVGKAVTATVAVTSIGNGGGKVNLYQGTSLVGSGNVAAGATSGSVTFTPSATGQLSLTAVFLPTLLGVAASTSEVAPITVAAAPAVSSTTRVAVSAKPVVGKSVTFTATVAASKAVAGSVDFFDGTKKLGTARVAPATGKATLKVKATKRGYAVKGVFTSSSPATVTGSTSSVLKVTAAKASAKLKVSKIKSVRANKKAKFTVSITVSGVKATGKVVVKSGKKTLKSVTLKNGKATVTLPKLKRGKHTLTISYAGSATVAKAKAVKKTLTVTKAPVKKK